MPDGPDDYRHFSSSFFENTASLEEAVNPVNQRNDNFSGNLDGLTPLMAIFKVFPKEVQVPVAKALIAEGADPDITAGGYDYADMTAAHFAAMAGNLDGLKVVVTRNGLDTDPELIKKRVNAAGGEFGQTVLMYTRLGLTTPVDETREMVQWLLDQGVDPAATTYDGKTSALDEYENVPEIYEILEKAIARKESAATSRLSVSPVLESVTPDSTVGKEGKNLGR